MKNEENIEFQNNRLWLNIGSLSSILATVFLPKCPLCFVAILSAVGIGGGISSKILFPLTAVFILFAIGTMFWQVKRNRNFKPLYLSVVAAALILIGKFFDFESLFYAGAGLFMVSVIASNYLFSKPKCQTECKC